MVEPTRTSNNSCILTLKLVGDYWTLRIIDALARKELRYCELQREAGGVNPVTFTNKLKRLEECHMVERIAESRAEVTYKLTDLGRKFLPVLASLQRFASEAKKVYIANLTQQAAQDKTTTIASGSLGSSTL